MSKSKKNKFIFDTHMPEFHRSRVNADGNSHVLQRHNENYSSKMFSCVYLGILKLIMD